MTTLALRILKQMHGPNVRLGAVADIVPVGTSREKPAPAFLRGLVLPIGDPGGPFEPLTVAVEPGRYLVQATLPSGEVLTEEIDATGPEMVSVNLVSEESPHEWLGKLQALGGVPSWRMRKARRSILGVAPVARPLDVHVLWFEAVTSKARINDWLKLSSTVSEQDLKLLFGSLKKTGRLKSVFANDDYEKFEIADIPAADAGGIPPVSLKALLGTENPSGRSRHYLALEDDTGIRGLAVLPLPWPYSNQNDSRAGQQMPVQIVLREPAPGSCFAESPVQPYISVDDPDVGALLGFLGRLDLQSAGSILVQAAQWLYEKVMNPLAAAAGGYILLAAGGLRGVESDEWKDWVKNLANWFEWLPDGSIQLAWLKLNSISPEDEAAVTQEKTIEAIVEEARELLLRALGAGVPLYSNGVRLLVDALTLVANHEEYRGKHETAEGNVTARALMLARWLSRRTDPSQPFTAIRI
jgi:hypothetical protein